MSEPSVTSELDRLQNTYRIRFAGHSRVSRDPDELDEILATLTTLEGRATAEEKERIARDRDLYARELEQIKKAHAVPFAVPAARLRMWADFALNRYTRSFAAQDRRTRDVNLLEAIRDELTRLRKEMAALDKQAPDQGLAAAIETIDRSLDVYQNEAEAIRTVRRTGSLPEQGSRFANLANDQFATYAALFAGEQRVSRHAPALTRIIGALEEILRGMKSLRLGGLNDPSNDNNQKIVADRIEQYKKEHDAIVAVQRAAAVSERVNALGSAANKIFAEYRENFAGKDRASRELSKLAAIGEKLWPVAKEMDAIDQSEDNETNARNLRIVTDNLLLYHREWDAIKKAKAEAGGGKGVN